MDQHAPAAGAPGAPGPRRARPAAAWRWLAVLAVAVVGVGWAGSAAAHVLVDVVTSASRSINPLRACDFDRDGAIRDSEYCRCDDAARAGDGNYHRRGSQEFCACDPARQHCEPDGTYADGTPRYRWTLDCNDFSAATYPQRCDAQDCNPSPAAHPHCAGMVGGGGGGDADGDGHRGVASGGDDCDDRNPSIFPGAPDGCGDGIDANCDGLDCSQVDADQDGAPADVDCDDHNPAVSPNAVERCGNGIDDDCDGEDAVCAQDEDHDGHDAAAVGGDDCDDLNSGVWPGAPEVVDDGVDQDCDGSDLTAAEADRDGDGFVAARFGGGDCDDEDATRHPAALDACGDGVDQDCDGRDRVCSATSDLDRDGVPGRADGGGDCDDLDSRVYPGAEDVCGDGIDQDCDGQDAVCARPEAPAPGAAATPRRRTNRADEGADGDNCQAVGGGSTSWLALGLLLLVSVLRRRRGVAALGLLCAVSAVPGVARADCLDLDGDGHEIWWFDQCGDDCNDLDPTIHPGVPEVCGDGVDNNCDGQADEGCGGGDDADGDGVRLGMDCDDGNAAVYPGAAEVCGDGVDQDCDGRDLPCVIDDDGDGVPAAADCDDSDPTVRPGAPERCGDGIDQDCDGADDVCEQDADHDGHLAMALGGDDCDDHDAATYPGAPERCGDGRDQDCDGADAPCDRDGDGVPADEDCNDWVAAVRPGVEDPCGDGIDQDCDGVDPRCEAASDDADGDGFRAAALGGDDCQDHDRAMHPGAVDVCGDGVDQDCDGADAVCAGPAAEAPLPATLDPHTYAPGEGVPAVPHTSRCSATPGGPAAPSGWLWGLLVAGLGGGLMRRRRAARSMALAAAVLSSMGCAAVEAEPVEAAPLDPAFYAAHVDPILARGCSTFACHGDPARPLSLYAVSRQRLAADRLNTPIADDELCANFRAARAFVFADATEDTLILSKPLFLEDGGTWHGGGYHFGRESREYACIVRWLSGAQAQLDADGQVVVPAICSFDWNVDAAGEPVRFEARGFACDG